MCLCLCLCACVSVPVCACVSMCGAFRLSLGFSAFSLALLLSSCGLWPAAFLGCATPDSGLLISSGVPPLTLACCLFIGSRSLAGMAEQTLPPFWVFFPVVPPTRAGLVWGSLFPRKCFTIVIVL